MSRLTRWLQRAPVSLFSIYAMVASFSVYACMYAFRKPFTVATFEGESWLGIDYKIVLITAQVLGYTCSKFIGIKVVSELPPRRRAAGILMLIGLAGLALLGFALVPSPYNAFFLFLNGLPLGMVWGLVFGYLEGRRNTELLGAGLSVSFIVASGWVKTVGKWLLLAGVSPFWMPLFTGLLFAVPLVVSVYLLHQLPPPSAEDERLRTRRAPMNRKQRSELLLAFAPGLVLLILAYVLLTAFRDFRDNFMAELWVALGYGDNALLFTLTEVPVAISVLLVMSLLMLIRSNRRALSVYHALIALGFALIGGSTAALEAQWLSPPVSMTLIGLGVYLAYVPFNSILFDRLLATFKYVGTAGFLIYVADAFGYLGSVGVLFYRNFGQGELSWLQFFVGAGYTVTGLGVVLMAGSWVYFSRKSARLDDVTNAEVSLSSSGAVVST